VRAQAAASIDAVVFVARRRGATRRVESIAEVDGNDRVGVRALFEHRDGRLVPMARAQRPARRPDAPSAEQVGSRC
jgi:hypothetical protein